MTITTGDITPYDGGHVYILDKPSNEERPTEFTVTSPHDQKNNHIERLFAKHFEYETHNVAFEESSRPDDVLKYFKAELKKMKKREEDNEQKELMIVYFHGRAGHNGPRYTWRFQHFPYGELDAYELIGAIIESGVDCLLLLDCYIPDRFHLKWKPGAGNVEIVATGQALQNPDGTAVANEQNNFTSSLIVMLDDFVTRIATRYKGFTKPKSIPQLLALPKMHTRLNANPRRIWISRTKREKDDEPTIVDRFVMLPNEIRATKKVHFHSKRIESPEDVHGGVQKGGLQEDGLDEDEGLGDMDEGDQNDLFLSQESEADDELA